MNNAVKKIFRRSSRVAQLFSNRVGPTGRWDAVFTVGDFLAEHGRLPRSPSRDDSGIMDYFFWRKHQPWSDLESRCCDKGLAKRIAQDLAPEVKVPATVATIPLIDVANGAQLRGYVAPFVGKKLVMKPAHSNGGVLFLDNPVTDWDRYLDYARRPFFPAARERQYHGLTPNLIIEDALATHSGEVPEDYKFFCFKGQPLLCQLDYDRFTDHKRQLYLLPEWKKIDVDYTYPSQDRPVVQPAMLDQAMAICQALSRPFDFVRIDLYFLRGGIYFGEFTFTPDAGTKSFSNTAFDQALGEVVRSGKADHLRAFLSQPSARAASVP